ncbi:MAG: c-type cytochrome, partial [Acidobacteria bacterium]|nr:c-type cytochrome [Acidobacteriota bacterium]
IDRGAAVRIRQRTFAIGLVLIAGLGWAALTAAAVRSTPNREAWETFTPEEVAAIGNFRQAQCWRCHGTTPGDNKGGPNLADIAVREDRDWLVAHFRQNGANSGLRDLQWRQLANFMRNRLDDESVSSLQEAPQAVVRGAQLFMARNCGICHSINGTVARNGPPLNGVAKRRDRAWMEGHFLDPQRFSPGTAMPPYKFTSDEMGNMLAYMETLRH